MQIVTVPYINKIVKNPWDILQIPLPSNSSIPSGTLQSRTHGMCCVLEYIISVLRSIQTEAEKSTFQAVLMQYSFCCSSTQLAFAKTHCTAYLLLTCLPIFKTRKY